MPSYVALKRKQRDGVRQDGFQKLMESANAVLAGRTNVGDDDGADYGCATKGRQYLHMSTIY